MAIAVVRADDEGAVCRSMSMEAVSRVVPQERRVQVEPEAQE